MVSHTLSQYSLRFAEPPPPASPGASWRGEASEASILLRRFPRRAEIALHDGGSTVLPRPHVAVPGSDGVEPASPGPADGRADAGVPGDADGGSARRSERVASIAAARNLRAGAGSDRPLAPGPGPQVHAGGARRPWSAAGVRAGGRRERSAG